MRDAEIYSVPGAGRKTFEWRWRANGGRHASSRRFAYYFDCIQDARRHGYRAQFKYPLGAVAPGAAVGAGLK